MKHTFEGYMNKNRKLWDELTIIHVESPFYDVPGFKAGKLSINSIEQEEVGDVNGKTLLHLQCHFGLDTLSWARLGAKVVGVDFSSKAIGFAQTLAHETGLNESKFICAEVSELCHYLPESEAYDIVFTSYGALCWLPDLSLWIDSFIRFLKPGGMFYIVDYHPLLTIFDNNQSAKELRVVRPYYYSPVPTITNPDSSYAERSAHVKNAAYEWHHTLGEIVTALCRAGLKIEFLHEFPVCNFQFLPSMIQDNDGLWHSEGDFIPLIFSLKASRVFQES